MPTDPYYNRLTLPNSKVYSPYDTLQRAFVNFPPLAVVDFMSKQVIQASRTAHFHHLLMTSEWRSIIYYLEHDLRRLQSQLIGSLERSTLEAMGAFRRVLADSREVLASNEAEMMHYKTGGLAANDVVS